MRRIAFYGGTDLSDTHAAFVQMLAEEVLARNHTIVTGGVQKRSPEGVPVDYAVLEAAKEYSARHQCPLESLIETWRPDPTLDDEDGVTRFAEGRVRWLLTQTAQARRFVLVQEVDAVVTFKGHIHTATVLDLAFAIGRPAMPLPFTDGDSRDYWAREGNRDRILQWFGISDARAKELETLQLESLSEDRRRSLARDVAEWLSAAAKWTCFALLHFGDEPLKFYRTNVAPTLRDSKFEMLMMSDQGYGGNVYRKFLANLNECDCIIADITEVNANVMFELGHVHARELPAFLYRRKPLGEDLGAILPFYLKALNIVEWEDKIETAAQDFNRKLREFLAGVAKRA